MKTLVHFVVLLAFADSIFAVEPKREDQADDICEAVFRYQIGLEPPGEKENSPAFFLAVVQDDYIVSSSSKRNDSNSLDPSDEFMKRFADFKQPVRKYSKCNVEAATDKVTGAKGLILLITSITWKTDSEVEVRSGANRGPSHSSGYRYTLKKEKGKWTVADHQKLWRTSPD